MKKYLIKGAWALFAGTLAVSCSEQETEYVPIAQQKAKAFEDVFKEVYGDNIDPYQKWGFSDRMDLANGDSVEFEDLDDVVAGARVRTRAVAGTRGNTRPAEPTFRDNNPITKPTVPSFPTTLPEGITKATDKDWNNGWNDGDVVYIDGNDQNINSNKSNITVYVNGDLTYNGGISSNGDGYTFIVLQGKKLTLNATGHNLKIYLAPSATLNLSDLWGNPYTLEKSNAMLYLSTGSRVNAANLKLFDGCKVLNAGGTIVATSIDVDKNTTLWNEGYISVSSNLQLVNENAYVYNASGMSITVSGNLNIINNNDLFYNDGTVTCTSNVALQNSGAELINNNSLTVSGNYSQAAGAKTHNVGTASISGKTDLTNGNSSWMNECDWTTGSFDIDNYSYANFNKGKLTVDGRFFLNRGTFVNDGGALVSCNSFQWEDTSDFYLGSKSKLDVSGTLTTNNYNSGYGFRGEGSEYAIISAGEIAKGKGDVQFSMSYFGNLYINTSDHFAQGALDPQNNPPAQPYYYYDSTVKFSFNGDSCPVTFTEPTCGTTPHVPVTGEGSSSSDSSVDEDVWTQVTEQSGRVFCEDLGQATREDLDYNDVVFDVIIWNYKTKTTTTTTTYTWTTTDGVEDPGSRTSTESTAVTYSGEAYYAQVTLMAAGGTLPLTVADQEVHAAFGVGVETMVNTVNDYSTVYGSYKTLSPVSIGDITKTVKYNGKTEDIKLFAGYEKAIDIPIVVNYNGASIGELSADAGKAPHKLFVPLETKWAVERKNLALAYPDFVNYVSDASKSWTTSSSRDSYYMYNEGDTRGLGFMPTVIKNRRTSILGIRKNLWTGAQPFGTDWTLKDVKVTFNADVLYPGDRLRFYGKGIGNEAWINVSINSEKPYLLDSEFPNYVFDANGTKVTLEEDDEGFIEVVLGETTAALLNKLIEENYSFVVQGRNFTLTKISVVEF